MASSITSPACCTIPPVAADYAPKGKMQNIGGVDCYVIGNEQCDKAIVGIFDVFGYWPSTQQGADILAAMTNVRVILPDFFAGSPLPQDVVPWDTPEKKAAVDDFMKDKGSPLKCRDALLTVAKALQESGVSSLGLYGLCWGSKGATLACGEGTPFLAFVQIHPSFVDPQDANQIRIPVASFTSKDEPQDILEKFYKNLQANPEITKCISHHYPNNQHGFAGARAKLQDPENLASFQDVYKRTAEFFLETVGL